MTPFLEFLNSRSRRAASACRSWRNCSARWSGEAAVRLRRELDPGLWLPDDSLAETRPRALTRRRRDRLGAARRRALQYHAARLPGTSSRKRSFLPAIA